MQSPKFFLLIHILAAPAFAQEGGLLEELVRTSPALEASRREAEAARAEVWAARGQRLPQLSLEARASTLEETIRITGAPDELTAARDPAAASAVLEQAVFTSGRIGGAIGSAEASASAAAHRYDADRQDTILLGVRVVADLVRDRAVLAERTRNEEVARGRLGESRARESAGLLTVTDLRQSEARLALAVAERLEAEAALVRAQASFRRVFGMVPPSDLTLPRAALPLPADLEAALDEALRRNPDLAASADRAVAANQTVRAQRGGLLPQVSLRATASYIEDERFGIALGEAEQYAVTLNGRWEIFRGGSGYAETKAARERARAADDINEETRRLVRERTITAWSDLLASRGTVRARKAQADAAKIAAEGVAAEFRNGRRTRLDVLDADREVAEADVALLAAQRNLAVARFTLLRAMGAL